MRILGTGVNLKGQPLFQPEEESIIADQVLKSMEQNIESINTVSRATARSATFKGEIKGKTKDFRDPLLVGWSYLLNAHDPKRADIQEILKPLALLRGMEAPLLFENTDPDEWLEWLNENYYGLNTRRKKVPRYVLIAGGPDQVPFKFQSILDGVASVGRVQFDTLDDLDRYVKKIIRIEAAPDPLVDKEVVIFATDQGPDDATYYSQKYMAQPIIRHIRDELNFKTHNILGPEATRKNLLQTLVSRKPALVYTASHGLGGATESPDFQKHYNGAVCCQYTGDLTMDDLFSAQNVPTEQPFLEGAVFFQFACFSYGTPGESDYAHWMNKGPEKNNAGDFIAALPKRLLAHPRGPIAFIGHMDEALLLGFDDPNNPDILERWHNRIAPFVHAVDSLLGVEPPGMAMDQMNDRYNSCNAMITYTIDKQKRNKLVWDEEHKTRFFDNWLLRGDAQNYMVFGDPGVHLRISGD
jgi:hypothetical protein